MQRIHQLLSITSLVALSWFAMMAVHELGHVVGAIVTGGNVERVILHPLTISRTDVSPNPGPAVVVWLGPILGCLIPVAVWLLVPRRSRTARNVAMFFAGFCLTANGAYIAIGSFDRVGDCGEMLRTGSPLSALIVFGHRRTRSIPMASPWIAQTIPRRSVGHLISIGLFGSVHPGACRGR